MFRHVLIFQLWKLPLNKISYRTIQHCTLKITEKYLWLSSISCKITGCSPTRLLILNSFLDICGIIENPLNLILCRTASLKNCFLCETLWWLLFQLVKSVFKLVKVSFSVVMCERRNGESGNGMKRMVGMG